MNVMWCDIQMLNKFWLHKIELHSGWSSILIEMTQDLDAEDLEEWR